MSIITLTTEWNLNDFYISTLKGKIAVDSPETKVMDIIHNLPSFDISQTAFVLRNSFKHFPEGSIHIIAVKSEASEDRKHVIVKYKGHYFIAADNGIFGLLLDDEPELVIQVDTKIDSTFPELDIFAPIACELANGTPAESLGEKTNSLFQAVNFLPTINHNLINGKVIYIDAYSNAISNISKELFDQVGEGRPFDILITSNKYKINKINTKYLETTEGELLAIFNKAGLLEIAQYNGRIAELIGLDLDSIIRVKFYDS